MFSESVTTAIMNGLDHLAAALSANTGFSETACGLAVAFAGVIAAYAVPVLITASLDNNKNRGDKNAERDRVHQ